MTPLAAIPTIIGALTTGYSLITNYLNKKEQKEIAGIELQGQIDDLIEQQEAFELTGGTGEYDPTLEGFEKYLMGADEEDLGSAEVTARDYLSQIDYLEETLGPRQEKLINEQLATIQGSARVSAAAGGIKSSSASVQALQEQSAENAALDIDDLWKEIHKETGTLETAAHGAITEAAIYKGKAERAGGWVDIYEDIQKKFYEPPEEVEPTEPGIGPGSPTKTDGGDSDGGEAVMGPYGPTTI